MKLASIATALAAVTGIAIATPAYAIPPTHGSTTGQCQLSDVKYNLGVNTKVNATACKGELEIGSTTWNYNNDVLGDGNPLLGNLNTLFGVNYNWSFVGKDESIGANTATNGFDGYSDATSGNWNVTQPLNGPFAISLKAGTGFSVYLFDNITQAVSSGVWSTAGIINNGGQQPNLSHMSLFKAQSTVTPPVTTSVPEPASLVGLGLVASGMVMSRRRRTLAN